MGVGGTFFLAAGSFGRAGNLGSANLALMIIEWRRRGRRRRRDSSEFRKGH